MMDYSFTDFYIAIHGRNPFHWQEDLADRVLKDVKWPEKISVPTASGKTSILDVAVFTLAKQAESGSARTVPMRTLFVVDRRMVVDDVTKHALKIRDAINESKDEVTEWAKAQLMRYGARWPLVVSTLRGGMYRSSTWVEEPNQPLICVSTVDQIGSRLLFRGYGVSPSRRPVDAGLTGNDSLIILDEAHLSNPFLETARAVKEYQKQYEAARPVQLVEMSATLRKDTQTDEIVRLPDEDWNSFLGERLSREKNISLKEVATLEKAAVEEALRLQTDAFPVVGVVLNTVTSARSVFEQIPDSLEKILLTGRIRPYDRDELLKEYRDRISAIPDVPKRKPLIVVATQTIEAGADLDFDALVTEIAPIDCLVQRFGRLNRVGNHKNPVEGTILHPKRTREGVGIYGEAPEQTWKWLSEHATDGKLNFSANAFRTRDIPPHCISPTPNAPLLLPAHLDAWVQTNPEPAEDPDVAPFLHGPATSSDIQIVWRADLPDDEPKKWIERISLTPPLSMEALPLPLRAARRWLRNQTLEPITDIETESVPAEEEEKPATPRSFVIWRGPEKSIVSENAIYRLRPGDTIVVQSSEGGCDQYGWNRDWKQEVADVGDECNIIRAKAGLGKYRLRLDPHVFYSPDKTDERKELQEILDECKEDSEEAKDRLLDRIEKRVPDSKKKGILPSTFESTAIWVYNAPRKKEPIPPEIFPDESDEDDSSSFTVDGSLKGHTENVLEKARLYAEKCAKKADYPTIEHAAKLHDQGKHDLRFQMALGAGTEPLAKSGTDSTDYARSLRRAGYPKGARHEFASVLIAQQVPAPPECDSQLALHLIGTHHGQGRPLAPYWQDDDDPEITTTINGSEITVRGAHQLARLNSGWIDRFWILNRKYGWWGLAFLEAILRRADCMASREEEEQEKKKKEKADA